MTLCIFIQKKSSPTTGSFCFSSYLWILNHIMRSVIPSSLLSIYIESDLHDENILKSVLHDRFSQYISFVRNDNVLYNHDKIIIINPAFPQTIKDLLIERYLPKIIVHHSCGGRRFLNSRYLEWTGCFRIEKPIHTSMDNDYMDMIISRKQRIHVIKYDGVHIRDEGDYHHMNFIYWEGLYNDLFRMNSYLWAHLHMIEQKKK